VIPRFLYQNITITNYQYITRSRYNCGTNRQKKSIEYIQKAAISLFKSIKFITDAPLIGSAVLLRGFCCSDFEGHSYSQKNREDEKNHLLPGIGGSSPD
jgi:hypothetical protein